jgi:gp16 family phage-associated protein
MLHQIKAPVRLAYAGSSDLYTAVRAGFVNQGKSLNSWCLANGLNRQTVEKALKGVRHSRRAAMLLDMAVEAAFPENKKGAA